MNDDLEEKPDLHPFEGEVPPETLADLNDKVNQIVTNGRGTVGALTAVVNSNRRAVKAVRWVAAVALIVGGLAAKASFDARNASRDVCTGQKASRAVLVKLVVLSYSPQQTVFDLTKFEHYDELDATTKAWVNDFQALIAAGAGQQTPGDKNGNHVPDTIDALLAKKVC